DVGLDKASSAPLWRPQKINTHTHQSTHLLPHLNVQFTPLIDAVSYVTVMSPASHQIILIRLTLLENTYSSHLYTQSQRYLNPFSTNQSSESSIPSNPSPIPLIYLSGRSSSPLRMTGTYGLKRLRPSHPRVSGPI